MTNQELQDFLYHEIPMAQALGVTILDEATVMGPLSLNRNHMETAFGGSLSSLLILSCYAWLFQTLDKSGHKVHVLIQTGHTDYLLPVKEDIKATTLPPSEADLKKFFEIFSRKGLARITLHSEVRTTQGIACSFKGDFVAQKV